MFATRLKSGIILVLLAFGLIMAGGPVLCVSLLLISWVGMYELYRIFKIEKEPLGIVGYVMAAGIYLYLYFKPEGSTGILMILLLSIIAILAVYVFTFPKFKTEKVLGTFFGVVYVALMLSYIYRTRQLDNGILVWLVFLSSWGCDTCAYCAGITLGRNGKHKMAPILSPKKSVEGGIGGVVGAVLLGALYGYFLVDATVLPNPVFSCAVVCGVGGLISMVGDLAASAIKRNYKIKDYGTLIPGHGGILDRFDSVIFTAPIIYYTLMLFMKGLAIL
ncbi:Phosphatidate cytidylyltransferase [Lachnospiraceae bacterium TWA4]|nr:Phosphatidate cytidylyltransferase [Lachnospiraceae bacterium TWA4]